MEERHLRKVCGVGLVLAFIAAFALQVGAQHNSTSESAAPIVLTGAIPLPSVKGRIDHFGIDPAHNRLFLSALGNNTEEIIGIGPQTVVHTIYGVPTPQGVAYSPETNKLFVGSDEGKLYVYDGTTFDQITSIDFGDDVDNLRYDAAEKRLYVGYGDEKTGGIGMVDAATNKRLDDEFKLGAHPESFQLAGSGPNIYVNLPDLKQIAVINRSTHSITRWPISFESNFPMALDEPDHRLFVATRTPPRLAVFDTNSGRLVVTLPAVQDSDDLYYDSARKRVYIPGGEGYISVFQQEDADHYKLLAKVQTAIGARTAGYFGKGRKASTVSTWLFPLARTMAPKCGSTRCRTRANEREAAQCITFCSGWLHDPQKWMPVDILPEGRAASGEEWRNCKS
jgi:DNA-binding beta-propeller fold protein YncE